MKAILNAGCGRMTEEGQCVEGAEITYLDFRTNIGADVVHNLNQMPLPFENNQFDEVWLYNIIEHLYDIFPLFEELHRITKPGGIIKISVPHYTDWTFWRDPSHRTHFNTYSFDRFQDTYNHHFDTAYPWKITKLHITIQRFWRALGVQWLLNKSIQYPPIRFIRRFWEQYLAFFIHGVNVYVEMQPIKQPILSR